MHNRGDWQFLSPCQGRYEKEQSIVYARRIVAVLNKLKKNPLAPEFPEPVSLTKMYSLHEDI